MYVFFDFGSQVFLIVEEFVDKIGFQGEISVFYFGIVNFVYEVKFF